MTREQMSKLVEALAESDRQTIEALNDLRLRLLHVEQDRQRRILEALREDDGGQSA